ncbi:MAG: tetratricopeptide repeat protein [Verrucomicrobiota bacterium]
MRLLMVLAASTWIGVWFTPDQEGQRLYRTGEYAAAAEAFEDPLWKGMAWYRAAEFEKAATQFARRDTAEAHFNRGNALVFRGKYEEAVAAYERAIEKRPDWKEAKENREIAALRAEATKAEGGDMGDQKIGADEIKFDNQKRDTGEDTEINTEEASTSQDVQALWLRRVQTSPADFLKAKFSYQEATRGKEEAP